MKLKIDISNKMMIVFVALLVLVSSVLIVYAYDYVGPIPNPGHSGDQIWLATADGEMIRVTPNCFKAQILARNGTLWGGN